MEHRVANIREAVFDMRRRRQTPAGGGAVSLHLNANRLFATAPHRHARTNRFSKKGEDDMYFISKEFSSKVLQQIRKRGLTTKLMLETTETS